jgi:hypothetical protein
MTICWLCGAPVRPDWPTLLPGQVPPQPAFKKLERPPIENIPRGEPRPFQFGLSTLLLIMTLIAVLCSVWRMAPGLGALLTVPTIIGLLGLTGRTLATARKGAPLTADEKFSAFLRPIWIAAVVVGAIVVVIFVSFLAVCFVKL